jgi:hypothetical protein
MRLLKSFSLICVALPVLFIAFVFARTQVGQEEHPPCSACSESQAKMPFVTVCELARNPERYAGTVVRVEANFVNDSGQLYLENSGCDILTGFASQWKSCRGTWRRLQVCTGFGSWYDGSAAVRVTGSFSILPADNYFQGEKGFALMCLEQVKGNLAFSRRWRFALGLHNSR